LNKEVEILKIGTILPDIKGGREFTIMVVFNAGPIFNHYVSILKEKCGNEYKYLKTDKAIVGSINNSSRFSKFDKPSDTLKGIQNKEPKIGESYGIGNWYTSTVNKIIDDSILITRNSVYAIHDVSKLRDKILNDLGIN
jgi:hypothetical protein